MAMDVYVHVKVSDFKYSNIGGARLPTLPPRFSCRISLALQRVMPVTNDLLSARAAHTKLARQGDYRICHDAVDLWSLLFVFGEMRAYFHSNVAEA